MNISEKEILNVIKLPSTERYKYFIKRVVDFEHIYTLQDLDERFTENEVNGYKILSLWPAEQYAERCISSDWIDCKAMKISMEDFKQMILNKYSKYLFNVFSIEATKSGFVVSAKELLRDIESEELYYS